MNTMFDFLERIQVQKEPGPEQYLPFSEEAV